MRIYGAGSLDEIKKCTELGAVGILTNPQGFDQYFENKLSLAEITGAIVEVTDLPVFIQIHGATVADIVKRGQELHKISEQVGFKIIADEKGFQAIRQLQQQDIPCIATTLFTVSQAAVAAMVGAFGICPFISRARANGIDPFQTLSIIKQGYLNLENPPEIIAVSMKSTGDVELALAAGVDAVGMRYPLLKQMMEHPLSTKAELLFAQNWANVLGEDVSYLAHALKMEGIAE